MSVKRQQKAEWPCPTCPVRRRAFCGALMADARYLPGTPEYPVKQSHHSAAPNEIVYSKDELSEDMVVICQGWAVRFIQWTDGRRQNLAVLLPGDLFSATALFQEKLHFSVQAVTELRISRFARADLKRRILADPEILEALGKACTAEQRDIDERAADLGRGSAEERIAHLIVSLVDRLAGNGVRRNHRYAFPLRQRHIADLTGLTPVHVSRVMSAFRKAGDIEPSKDFLTILNLPALERIARRS